MQVKGFDAIVAYSDEWRQGHVRYLSNYRPMTFNADGLMYTPAMILIPKKGEPTLFAPDNMIFLAQEASYVKNVKPVKSDLVSELRHFKESSAGSIRTVGLEGLDIMPFQAYKMVEEGLSGVSLQPSTVIREARMLKSKWEIEMLERACAITDQAVLAGLRAVKEGITEREIATIIHKTILDAGSEVVFGPEVGTGPKSGREDSVPSDRKVARGDFVLIDTGARWEGYCGDLTRGAACGPLKKEHRDVVNVVIEGYKKALQTTRVGARVSDIINSSYAVVKEAGYGEFPHEVVHGLGLDVEEYSFYPPDTVIQENMTFVVECAVYLTDEMGLRLEDAVVTTSSGTKLLNHLELEY
jgi:Xaa-Pro dipeptidase